MAHSEAFITESTLPALLRDNAPRLRNFVACRIPLRLRPAIPVEDILQEVWIDAFRGQDRVQVNGPDALDRWLTTLARRKLSNAIKRFRCSKRGGRDDNKHCPAKTSSFVELCTMMASTIRTPSSQAAVSEAARVIRIAIAILPEDYKRAICLRYMDGHPPETVAQIMNKPVSTVRGLIHRGLKKLQAVMGEPERYWSDAPTLPLE